jgi:cobalt/nickel transport system permease protein
MPNIINSLYNIHYLEDLSNKKTFVHRIHPVIKLITVLIYLISISSFDRYEISGLLPFFFFPIFIFITGEIPVIPILKRVIYAEPFIICIGILSPFFDKNIFILSGITFSAGWLVLISIIIKCSMTITAALLFMATTGIDRIAMSLRIVKFPRIFVLQFLLTYRYITVLIEEVSRTMNAYALRSFSKKGVGIKSWGSLPGQILLRTFDRAERIYVAMCVRGFDGKFKTGFMKKPALKDYLFAILWISLFIFSRFVNIPDMLGLLMTGVKS